ncbi:MAG TPA: alpha-1,4-glucan--maltose-1-phosphate maltosyltransferase [Usitatibacter sp.]|nr:alpha-1,4-glucan--maltose-1-phosphate maltosyltransferase [Usitatibacter sp.]
MNDLSRASVRETLAPSAAVENVSPQVDGGRFAIKRTVGEEIVVTADCFAHGHERVSCEIRYKGPGDASWSGVEMEALGNDRWSASIALDRIGAWQYGVVCWIDHLATWREGFLRRVEAEDVRLAALVGADLLAASIANADGPAREALIRWARTLREERDPAALHSAAMDDALLTLARRHAPRSGSAQSVSFPAFVDRERARFGSWYECFPRSMAAEPGRHGTLADVERNLDRIHAMGFDVLYLPPIHPIGRTKRKGRNNSPTAEPGDVGSPWGIGAREGGHTAIHPDLGTHEDFRSLVRALGSRGMEIAMDIAFQVAPDHPWVTQHPEWFRRRPDGSVQFAENPPKKYEDIYPIDFDTRDWRALWQTLREVIEFWIGEGVEIFRVDNPHTKPFAFWEWLIAGVRREHPRVIFLAEAFTRPRVMHRLAKLGFTQSYTYFTWRTTKAELTEYFTELALSPSRDYFRPNCWPNTPDILPHHLRNAPRAMFAIRLVLAATLSANYGIYGPAFELGENRPRDEASEEYLGSEKYEIKRWHADDPASLAPLVTKVNAIRHAHPALQSDWSLAFHPTDNGELLCYSKRAGDDRILVAVNLDPANAQSGWVSLDLAALGIAEFGPYTVEDLLTGERYQWWGPRNFLLLDPRRGPAHVFAVTPGH